MSIALHPLAASDLESWRSIAAHPTLAAQFPQLLEPRGPESKLADPFFRPSLCWLACRDGVLVGFLYTFVLEGPAGPWGAMRIGVTGDHRRRGVGSALLERALRGLEDEIGRAEAAVSAWLPSPGASEFAGRHGFRPDRTFWEMERPPSPAPEVAWPRGVEARNFDSSDRQYQDWCDAYHRSFAENYRPVQVTVEQVRAMLARPTFAPDGVMLAYRDGACVGFCRTSLQPHSGEVAILGVVPEARGIGLGRALLRWGVRWIADAGAATSDLLVDGDNENALRLYRSEGFAVKRTPNAPEEVNNGQ